MHKVKKVFGICRPVFPDKKLIFYLRNPVLDCIHTFNELRAENQSLYISQVKAVGNLFAGIAEVHRNYNAASLEYSKVLCPGKTIEKKIVREATADLLPEAVAWRQKEQFSDGVGYSWIDTLKRVTAEAVSDEQMKHAAERFPIHTPQNKEEYYYRSIFSELFPSNSAALCVPSEASVACSTAVALEWDAAFRNMNEPSGRAVAGVHEHAI